MGNIIKLDQKTANLIAAGEVVERPASVVKELVENAIDAKAQNIKIKLQDSGLKEIIVSDDGMGMDVVDAKLAVEPHATSKIKDGNDLFHISTLGFRGEALPSIAAVSQFKLKTSDNGIKGIMYNMKGGVIVSEATVACPRGTEITVRNLFYNTPARLQNLQSPTSELSHISDFIIKIAQANPDISFTLINNDREIIKTYGNNNVHEVIFATLGSVVARNMIKVYAKNNYFELDGYISNLNITRASKNNINIIVNQRTIRNYQIINAICNGYKDYLMTGRYPIVVLNINLDPGMVDVNVHPAKLEVRFSNENELINLITDTIKEKLEEANLLVEGNINEKESHNISFEGNNKIESENESFANFPFIAEEETEPVEISDLFMPELEDLKIDTPTYKQQNYTFYVDETSVEVDDKKLPQLTYLGQLFGTYLLAQADEIFYLIDQHAAAERINYEKIFEELKKDNQQRYDLLIPLKLDFSASEALLITENIDKINQLGITFEDFGSNSFLIRQIPTWIPKDNKEGFVEEIIMQIIYHQKTEKHEFLNNLAKDLACKRSIKANEFHNQAEIDYLLSELAKTKNPYTCPHGRPVIIKFTKYEIEKWFKRIV